MKKFSIVFFVMCFSIMHLYSQGNAGQEIKAAQQVMERVLKDGAKSFEFIKTEQADGIDCYEVHAKGGKVKVIGSSTIAMCHGAYDYLRKACHFQYTWTSGSIPIPKVFPDLDIAKITSPYQMRQYYNVCTYGYTTAFWGWNEWQKELDWMALHGINMPVAMIGQEAIWQKVWKSYGITDKELDDYFTGPAFLPWHRMGNVNKHGGPAPKSYYDKSIILQKQLLQRMRELGMMPIVPAFSGYVPNAIKRVMPNVGIIDMKPWGGFTKEYGTHMILPNSKQFTEIGKRFIDEYTKEYGKCKYYLADAFNEMKVPIKFNKYKELEDFGSAIYQSIHQADTAGIWVMQGWLFYNDKGFWDKLSVQAFLKDVPDNKMIIIDLANESFHGWEEQNGFYGKNWICSYIHNYGGKTQLGGDLNLFASDAPKMLKNPNHGKLCGFGISPEGINQNEVLYELLTDVAWTDKPIDLDKWLELWCTSRYGVYTPEIKKAWMFLRKSIYGTNGYFAPNLYQQRPALMVNHKTYMPNDLDSASFIYNAYVDNLKGNSLFKYDQLELLSMYLGSRVDFTINKALELYEKNDTLNSQIMLRNAISMMYYIDSAENMIPERRLETWVELARKWGDTPEEKNYYEEQAKRQITVWGGPVLSEYACKTWGGLIGSYYIPRWKIFYNTLFNKKPNDIKQWEENWITTPGSYNKTAPDDIKIVGHPLDNEHLFDMSPYKDYITIHSEPQEEGFYLISIDLKDTTLDIYYSTYSANPFLSSFKYKEPFKIKAPVTIKVQTFKKGKKYGNEAKLDLSYSLNKKVTLKEEPDGRYKAEGGKTLTDGIYGTSDFADGKWLGFEGKDMEATIDLGSFISVSKISVNYLVNTNDWIFAPTNFKFEVSEYGLDFIQVNPKSKDKTKWNNEEKVDHYQQSFAPKRVRYVRVTAKNRGVCPEGHPGAGEKSWIFIDEITVN